MRLRRSLAALPLPRAAVLAVDHQHSDLPLRDGCGCRLGPRALPADPPFRLAGPRRSAAGHPRHPDRLRVDRLPGDRDPGQHGCGGQAPAHCLLMWTGAGRRSCAASTSSTPSGCSSRSSAGPPPKSAIQPPPTGGPGSSSPAMPSSGSPGHSPPTCATPGNGPPRPGGSPRPGSAGGLETSARPSPAQPVRRNPASPAPDARQVRRTATPHSAMTWGKPARRGRTLTARRQHAG